MKTNNLYSHVPDEDTNQYVQLLWQQRKYTSIISLVHTSTVVPAKAYYFLSCIFYYGLIENNQNRILAFIYAKKALHDGQQDMADLISEINHSTSNNLPNIKEMRYLADQTDAMEYNQLIHSIIDRNQSPKATPLLKDLYQLYRWCIEQQLSELIAFDVEYWCKKQLIQQDHICHAKEALLRLHELQHLYSHHMHAQDNSKLIAHICQLYHHCDKRNLRTLISTGMIKWYSERHVQASELVEAFSTCNNMHMIICKQQFITRKISSFYRWFKQNSLLAVFKGDSEKWYNQQHIPIEELALAESVCASLSDIKRMHETVTIPILEEMNSTPIQHS